MLERLLSMLTEGGTYTPEELARRLGTSAELVESMLADLVRLGYLCTAASFTCQAAPNAYSTPCAVCSLSSACAMGNPGGRVWALTEKRPAQAAPQSANEDPNAKSGTPRRSA